MSGNALVIGFESALDYWLLCRLESHELDKGLSLCMGSPVGLAGMEEIRSSLRSPRTDDVVRALRLLGVPRPLHILAADGAKLFRSSLTCGHVWRHGIPEGMLYEVAPALFVCSPQMALLQCASRKGRADIARIAYPLCGTYASMRRNTGLGLALAAGLEQVMGVTELRLFAEKARAQRIEGSAKLVEALRCVVEGSNSPAESAVAQMMATSRRLGGFGLKGLELNAPVKLSEEGRKVARWHTLRPDGLFRAIGEGFDFDSKTWHSSVQARERDADRRAAFALSGIVVQSLTSGQAYDLEKLEAIAEGFERKLCPGRRAPSAAMLEARRALHGLLFPSGREWLGYAGHMR